jgi:transcriptional regulator with XRE-family HTH domain
MGSADDQDTGFYEALGRTIQVLRTDRELDRKELADRAGVSYSYLTAIENGTRRASPPILQALARALGLHSSELLASAERRHARAAAPTSGALVSRAPAAAPRPRIRATRRDPFWLRQEPVSPLSPPSDELNQDALSSAAPGTPSAPGFRLAIEALLPHLSAGDLEVVLTLTQRLAEPESPAT